MPHRIFAWIGSNRVATICCPDDGLPYCFNCFYAFHSASASLVFKSSPAARHSQLLTEGIPAAGTILPEVIDFTGLQGIQFRGTAAAVPAGGEDAYYQRFPFARDIPRKVYGVRLERIKMTDNTIVFGKKLYWEANAL